MAEAMDTTIEGLRTMIGFDAGADHRKGAAESDDTDAGKNATKAATKDK
ncbi:hypothetical protein [Sphingobium yanoikuyae]|nr:hypothetical protein [Sphingobium yanoikuyae]